MYENGTSWKKMECLIFWLLHFPFQAMPIFHKWYETWVKKVEEVGQETKLELIEQMEYGKNYQCLLDRR